MEKSKKIIKSVIILFILISIIVCFYIYINSTSKDNTKSDKEVTSNIENHNNISENNKIISYHYDDGGEPGSSYDVSINFNNGLLEVTEKKFSSAIDGKTKSSTNSIYLNDSEIEMLLEIVQKHESKIIKQNSSANSDDIKQALSAALSSIVLDNEIMMKKSENDEYWDTLYALYDLNGDGIVTQREFGNHYLKTILEEF